MDWTGSGLELKTDGRLGVGYMGSNIMVTQSSMPPLEEYIEKIRPLWESHWLTNMGSFHQELEQELKSFLGVEGCSLMVNGHMSLELAIQAMNFPKGGEVITTPYTFISTTHAIIRNGLTPVFCDIKLQDFTIDETRIESLITEKTVAILPVHVYGNICNTDKISAIADKYNLKVIYDAAHAFGETVNSVGVGNFGDASVFIFHATKVFNTIEGGAVVFSDPRLYQKLYDLKNFGIRSEELIAEVGANAKMNEFSAAMGLCNLPYVEQNIEERKKRFLYYKEKLSYVDGLEMRVYDRKDTNYSYGYCPVLFRPEILGEGMRDKIYDKLHEIRVYARKYFYPITSDAVCFRNKYRMDSLDNARYVGNNILVLPLFPELPYQVIDHIVSVIEENCIRKGGK